MSETSIIITIDTEVGEKARNVEDGFTKFIEGRVNGAYYGVPKIIEALDYFGFKGEFFVDVYEYKLFGESNYKDLCSYISGNGHGVQLHTHPSYYYDPKRVNMYQYSLEEQVKIIFDGKNLIKKWINQFPIAHRAGNYGADMNTLLALDKNSIKIDSSFFYNHYNCKIKLPTINNPVLFSNILEIPVTVIKKTVKLFGLPIPFSHQWLKLDINSLDEENLKKAILKLNNKIEYLVIFLHSSSFIQRDHPFYKNIKPDEKTLAKFINILKFIKSSGFKTILLRDININKISGL